MKSKVKVFRGPRSINDIDAVKIDWCTAINEAKALTERFSCGPFADTLRAYQLLNDIQNAYKTDNVSVYLDILENNRDVLKDGAVHFKEECTNG